jgi:hypothetical protein
MFGEMFVRCICRKSCVISRFHPMANGMITAVLLSVDVSNIAALCDIVFNKHPK